MTTVTNDNKCVVCMESYSAPIDCKQLACTHIFHKACIDRWCEECEEESSCPLCRRRIECVRGRNVRRRTRRRISMIFGRPTDPNSPNEEQQRSNSRYQPVAVAISRGTHLTDEEHDALLQTISTVLAVALSEAASSN